MAYFTTEKSTHDLAAAAPAVAQSYVDILYDHAGFLSQHGQLGPTNALSGKSVGIVGAGAAGLSAAFLLARQGAHVTVFEATQRTGGRVHSFRPIANDPAIFEMGAMRVPPSERVFGYFANGFNLKPGGQFPDPGKVDTNIIFQNKSYPWSPGGGAPSKFKNVHDGWKSLTEKSTNSWMNTVGKYLTNPATFAQAQQAWQQLINPSNKLGPEQGYSNISFYQGLVQAFVENPSKYNCKAWTAQDFALFGALGLGSGGFGPLYQVNFAELARLVVNGLESNQQFYPDGLETLTDGFASNIGSSNIKFNSEVVAVTGKSTSQGPVQITYKPNGTTPVTQSFDAVVVATTTRSMQVDMSLTDPLNGLAPTISAEESTAIRQMHLMNSSKLFVLTKNKFWINQTPALPANIQTDGLVRGLYCLDYPNSQYGVVLISYTWGDDSTKTISIKDPDERRELLLNSLEAYVPEFVQALRANLMPQYTKLIDWQDEPHYYGAFKLNYPGQDIRNQSLYYQFLNGNKKGVYLAGDSVGWCGGWIEGALQTGVNAASGVVNQLTNGQGLYPGSPMTQTPSLYDYGS